MIIFANVLLDKSIITSATFTALLLMAVASTMLTVPLVSPRLARLGIAGSQGSLRAVSACVDRETGGRIRSAPAGRVVSAQSGDLRHRRLTVRGRSATVRFPVRRPLACV
jgi:hypothetical protein